MAKDTSWASYAQDVANKQPTSGIFYNLLATFLLGTLVQAEDNKSGHVGADEVANKYQSHRG